MSFERQRDQKGELERRNLYIRMKCLNGDGSQSSDEVTTSHNMFLEESWGQTFGFM